MENQFFGITTVLLCTFLYYLSFYQYKKGSHTSALLLIILGGLLLRIFTASDLFLHDWDERFHALVAKHLIDYPFKPMLYTSPILGYNYKEWSSSHVWVHKQPIPLYSMALSMLLFGKNVIALRIPSILLSTITILFTYKIGRNLFSSKVGLLAAFLCSINGLIIELASGRVATDHIDIFFLAFITIAVYYAIRFSKEEQMHLNLLCGLFIGLAILCKWLPALIVLPIWFLLMLKEHRKVDRKMIYLGIILLLTVFIIAAPWQFYIYHYFPLEAAWEAEYNRKHIFEVLGTHGHPWYYHLIKMGTLFGELVYLPIIWLIYISIKKRRFPAHLVFVVWIIIPYLFFSLAKTKMQGYVLFTSPAFFILIALFIHYLWFIRARFRSSIFIKLIVFLLLILPIRYSIERIKPFDSEPRTKAWVEEVKSIDSHESNPNKVIFNCKHPIKTMFHTQLIAYSELPEKSVLENLHQSGYSIHIDNFGAIPDEIKKLKFVAFHNVNYEE